MTATAACSGADLDLDRLGAYLSDRCLATNSPENFRFTAPIAKCTKFGTGQSNPTFLLEDVLGFRMVLRKQPAGRLLPTAHAVDREFRVMSALFQDRRVPVPQPYILCEDTAVIGTKFFVMSYVEGRNFRDLRMLEIPEVERAEAFHSIVECLANLHQTDFVGLGLADFGRPDDYYGRQLGRWWKQFEASISKPSAAGQQRERADDRAFEAFKSLHTQLEAQNTELIRQKPGETGSAPQRFSLVHGDFRIDNFIFHPTRPQIIAIVDWELSTIGDPLADVGYFALMYHFPFEGGTIVKGFGSAAAAGGRGKQRPLSSTAFGVPSEEDLLRSYCLRTGRMHIPHWPFYLAFALFRVACILQGVFARAKAGNASSKDALAVGSLATFLAQLGSAILGKSNSVSTFDVATLPIGMPTCFPFSKKALELYWRVRFIVETQIVPLEQRLRIQHMEASVTDRFTSLFQPRLEALKKRCREEGLWNLFIPPAADGAENRFGGSGLSVLDYALVAEAMGRSLHAPEVFNCQAPDSGNMEVLMHFGTREQQNEYLQPLLSGAVRSAFAMTETSVASSDPTNLATVIRADPAAASSNDGGGDMLLNGRKCWITGAGDPRCKFFLVMAQDETLSAAGEEAPQQTLVSPGKQAAGRRSHSGFSIVLVPSESRGVRIFRALTTFGYDHAPQGHWEIEFENVRLCRKTAYVGHPGMGFAIAQSRLGPGRMHHCQRLVGLCERAVEETCRRALSRSVFGQQMSAQPIFLQQLSRMRAKIQQARLLVLSTAFDLSKMPNMRSAASKTDVSLVKMVVPALLCEVLDECIQIHGAAGLGQDSFLAEAYVAARCLRIADGPDVVHELSVGKAELGRMQARSKL